MDPEIGIDIDRCCRELKNDFTELTVKNIPRRPVEERYFVRRYKFGKQCHGRRFHSPWTEL